MKQRTFSKLSIFVLGAFIMIASAKDVQSATAPDGFDKYLVYMAAGVYNPSDPDFVPPTGDFFHREIMGRSDEEIEEERDKAIAFFADRFGIDVDDPGVMFISFMLDPRNEYRAYTISGVGVPKSGYIIRDGGYMVSVVDPAGIDLGGDFTGTNAPIGTFFVYGDYNIKRGQNHNNIIIHYQSLFPVNPPNEHGIGSLICETIHEDWGTGRAQGVFENVPPLDDGRIHANFRTVLTFSGLGAVPEN